MLIRSSIFTALSAATVAASSPASATTYATQKFECPVGGEKFKADVVLSNITFGQRADGKPYSPLPVPPIVECPENGLLLIDEEFSDADLLVLRNAVHSEEYQAMRGTETPHFRAFWLKKQLGRDPASQLSSLLQATWETDENYDRKVRYQARFIAEATGWKAIGEDQEAWFWFNVRAVNALRELGYFTKAEEHLKLVALPENLPESPEAAQNGKEFIDRLSALLKDKNPLAEPANLVPSEVAMFRCVDPQPPLTPAETSVCAQERIQNVIREFEFKPKGGKMLQGATAVRAANTELRKQN